MIQESTFVTSIRDTFKHIDPEKYKMHLENEKKFYEENHYGENLLHTTSSGLRYVHQKLQERVYNKIGYNIRNYTIKVINDKGRTSSKPIRILSLASGPGGSEIDLARKFEVMYSMDCIDINETLLKQGQKKADEEKLNLKFIQQDINEIVLPEDTYDLVFAHAALHHLINHEHVAEQVYKSMKSDAVYVVYDVIVRNGMLLWNETREIVNKIMPLLPERYRKVDPKEFGVEYLDYFPEKDTSKNSMECIRSQDIYDVLKKYFKIHEEILGFSFVRRFVDHPFRKNYDVENNQFDKAILDTLLELDKQYTSSHHLKPESVVMVLGK